MTTVVEKKSETSGDRSPSSYTTRMSNRSPSRKQGRQKSSADDTLTFIRPGELRRGMEFMHPSEARWCRATDVINHHNHVEISYRSRVGNGVYTTAPDKSMLLVVPIEVTRAEDEHKQRHARR
jgi:hypothetical protein